MTTQSTPTVQQLRSTVEGIDCQAQSALSEIAALCRLSLTALETPHGWQQVDAIASALETIWGKADDAKNSINAQAEGVGCGYEDIAWMRRMRASAHHLGVQMEVAA